MHASMLIAYIGISKLSLICKWMFPLGLKGVRRTRIISTYGKLFVGKVKVQAFSQLTDMTLEIRGRYISTTLHWRGLLDYFLSFIHSFHLVLQFFCSASDASISTTYYYSSLTISILCKPTDLHSSPNFFFPQSVFPRISTRYSPFSQTLGWWLWL